MSDCARSDDGADGGGRVWRVAMRLHSTAIHLLRRARREDARAGLSPARLSALSVLVFGGPQSLGEVASAEQVRAPTMSRIAAALERDGYIVRRSDPRDGRVVRLEATPRGRRVLEEGRDRRVAHLAALLGELSEAELVRVSEAVRLLESLLAASRPGDDG